MDKLKSLFKKDSSSSDSHHRSSGSEHHQSSQHGNQQTQYASTGAQAGSQQQQQQQQQQVQSQGQGQRQTQGHAQAQGVLLTTTLGNITVIMFNDKTPKTCQNFVGLADAGRYNGVVFHRIIPNFMIQGGDPTGTGRGGESIWGGKFEDEFHPELTHTGKGILSMANSGPGTNGSQFFITLTATPHLNGKHTVFGQVVDGMDVVDRLGAVQRDSQDRPMQEVAIIKAESFTV